MNAIQIGPLALPTAPLPWLAALLAAWLLIPRLTRWMPGGAADLADEARRAQLRQAEDIVWGAAAVGFGVSRAAFVALHWDAYAGFPWSIVDLRDGGWAPWPGLAAAAAWVVARARRAAGLRRALGAGAAAATLAGLGVWLAVSSPRNLFVPSIPLATLQGQMAQLDQIVQGRPAVINLWASWCAPCRVEMPALAAQAQAQPGVRFLFVNQGERADAVQRYLHAQDFRLEGVWLDPAARLGPAVGSRGLPTTLFVDAKGHIVHVHMGILNQAAIRARLATLMR